MKSKFSPSQLLLILLAAGQGASLVYASVALDGRTEGPMFWFALVRGLLVGIGASFSSAYAGYQLPRLRHKLASRIGWTTLGALVACSAVVVGVCTVETPQNGLRWLVGGAYAVMVDAAVIATSMASGKVFSEAPVAPLEAPVKRGRKKKTAAEAPVVAPIQAVVVPTVPAGHWEVPHPCPHCAEVGVSWETANRAQYSGHVGKCANNPARQFAKAAQKV